MRVAHLIVYEQDQYHRWVGNRTRYKKDDNRSAPLERVDRFEALSTPVGRRGPSRSGVPKTRKIRREWLAVEDDGHCFEADCELEFLTLEELVRNNSDFTNMEADGSNWTFD